MALLFMDNFQQFGTNAALMLNGPYAEAANVTIVADPDPTAGGTTVAKLVTTAATGSIPWATIFRKVLTGASTVGVMLRVWMSSLPADTLTVPKPIWFTDSSKNTMVSLRITINGTIQAWRSNTNAPEVLLGESAACVLANAWQHIEAKVVFDPTAGSVEVRVGTQVVLNITGQNTQGSGTSTTCANVMCSNAYFGSSSGPAMYIKDFAIWDTAGTINANFLGNCYIASLRPDSDVSGTWTITGGAGSAFASINESAPDDDTKYISSPWAAATPDVVTVSDLPVGATGVKALMPVTRARKSDGGDGSLQTSLVSGASTANGTSRPITTAYIYYNDIMEVDPATGVAWTVAATNAVKLKMDRTL